MKIAVLMGGPSAEREVSLRSGEAVYQALSIRNHEVKKLEISDRIAAELQSFRPEVVFIAAHGKPGEDGTIQGLLEILGLPYTGSRVLASALAMDKIASKRIFLATDIPTPEFMVFGAQEIRDLTPVKVAAQIIEETGLPAVIKAPTQGSTIGTYIVREEGKLPEAIEAALQYDSRILAERFVPGPEITAAVLGNDDPVVLPLIEIISRTGFYDYQAKYTAGLSEHLIPPRLPEKVQKEIRDLALRTYKTLGCRGFARIDFIVEDGQKPKVLEVNTVPGLTEVSLFPDAARAAGMGFADLVEKIISLALEDFRNLRKE
ncbi:MAG: D-alanine-D-alanine ligase [Clostridia bacterium]|nr:D-alanine-D-alanine ligase [Clostridia bacterium]